jgi:hypothetical protein
VTVTAELKSTQSNGPVASIALCLYHRLHLAAQAL